MQLAASRLGVGVGGLARAGLARTGAAQADERRRDATAQAFAAIALAADAGMRLVDCPAEPDVAADLLGEVLPRDPAFRVVLHTTDGDGPEAIAARLKSTWRRLRRDRADALLLRGAGAHGEDGRGRWDALLRLKDEGLVDAVGLAACVCDDPSGLARRLKPDLMQLPLSLLDQRLLANGALDDIAGRGVEVHLRSVFLHGRLFGGGDGGSVRPLGPSVARLRRILAEAGADPMQAALAFALSRPQAQRVVVGVGSAAELRAVVRAAAASGPAVDWEALRSDLPCPALSAGCMAA